MSFRPPPRARRPILIAALLCVVVFARAAAVSAESEGPTEGQPPVRQTAVGPTSVRQARNTLHRHLTEDEWAEFCFLEYLGWRVVIDPKVAQITPHAGKPCAREDLAESLRMGDLQIRVPGVLDEAEIRRFAPQLEHLSMSIGTRCAYKLKLNVALETAVKKLAENAKVGRYGFPELFGLTFLTFQCKPPKPEWYEYDTARLWRAGGKPSAAIESIYNRTSVIECYVAHWIAIYAAQYEMYGADWFDRTFAPDEIVIGRARAIRDSHFGGFMRKGGVHPYKALLIPIADQKKSPSLTLLAHGRQALPGLGGIVRCQAWGMDCFENITIVSLSKACADVFRKRGGFGWIELQSKKIWAIHDQISGLFVARDYKARKRKEIEAMLAEPEFSEFMVYIHPYGVISMRDVVHKKFDQGGTPISVSLYTHGREDAMFRRFHDAVKQRCLQTAKPAAVSRQPARPAIPTQPTANGR